MEIITDYKSINNPTAITIGSFDGIHLGHIDIINKMIKNAREKSLKTAIVTFLPHPNIFFNKDCFKLINTQAEKIELLSKTGIDYLIIQKFDLNFVNQEPEMFIKKLKDKYSMQILFMGYDHHFGKDKKGNFKYIKSLEKDFNFKVKQLDAVYQEKKPISSSLIREEIKSGNIEKANLLLGYEFYTNGKVVSGNRIGNKLGFPTANIEVDDKNKIKPKQGVYIVKSTIKNKDFYGMMNIGTRPTINGTREVMEVHFFDFENNIYGKNIKISFLKRIRNEQKFDSLEALTNQLKIDKEFSIKWLANKFLIKN